MQTIRKQTFTTNTLKISALGGIFCIVHLLERYEPVTGVLDMVSHLVTMVYCTGKFCNLTHLNHIQLCLIVYQTGGNDLYNMSLGGISARYK